MSRYVRTVTRALILAFGCATLFSLSSSAISNVFFDNGDVTNGANIHAIVSRDYYVPRGDVNLRAYFTSSSNRQLYFSQYHYCPGNGRDLQRRINPSNGTNMVRYTISWKKADGSNGSHVFYGKKNKDCGSDNLTYTIPGNIALDQNTGYYVVNISATPQLSISLGSNDSNAKGYQNTFWVRANGSNSRISHKNAQATQKGNEVTVEQVDRNPAYIDYHIKFGADCSVTRNQASYIYLYDLDTGENDGGAQPKPIDITLYESNGPNQAGTSIDTRYKKQGGSWSAWRKTHTNVKSAASGTTHTFQFQVKPNKSYRLKIGNIYWDNTIQYGMPYDGIYYERKCQRWNITPSTVMRVNGTIRNSDTTNPFSVRVGDTIRWTHAIANDGPGVTDRVINWRVNQHEQPGSGHTYPLQNTWASGRANGASLTRTQTMTIGSADVGKRLCQRMQNQPNSSSNNNWESASWRCVQVENGYQLESNTDQPPTTFTDSPSFNVTGDVRTRSGAVAGSHDVQLVAYQYSSSTAASSSQLTIRPSSSETPCSVADLQGISGYEDCKNTEPAQSISNFDGSPDPQNISVPFSVFGYTEPSGGYPLGTTFCFMVSVKNPTQASSDDDRWYHSTPRCTTKSKRPALQVHGGDVRATGVNDNCNAGEKGYIRTQFTNVSGRNYGSWGEFGAFSRCNNYNFTTGANLSTGRTNITSSLPQWHSLTFANTDLASDPPYGSYANNFWTEGKISLSACPNSAKTYTSFTQFKNDSDTNLSSLQGVHCIESNSGITVTDDVVMDDTVSSLKDIPQLIIISNSGTVSIDEDVERVDAWIVTDDLRTCVFRHTDGAYYRYTSSMAPGSPGLSDSRCNEQLVINGPVVVGGSLYADRTYGSIGDDREKAGEVFNLPASAVLWWYQQQIQDSSRISTASIKELPPRY